jgi:hypothetical protein
MRIQAKGAATSETAGRLRSPVRPNHASEETLSVNRWTAEGYLEVLTADRTERVRAEPFDAIEPTIGVQFGDDEQEP